MRVLLLKLVSSGLELRNSPTDQHNDSGRCLGEGFCGGFAYATSGASDENVVTLCCIFEVVVWRYERVDVVVQRVMEGNLRHCVLETKRRFAFCCCDKRTRRDLNDIFHFSTCSRRKCL